MLINEMREYWKLLSAFCSTRRRGKKTSATRLEDDAESMEMQKQRSPTSPVARNTG